MKKIWNVALIYADYDDYQYNILCSFENESDAELFATSYQNNVESLAQNTYEHNLTYDYWAHCSVVIEETILSGSEDETLQTSIIYQLNHGRLDFVRSDSQPDISALIVHPGSVIDKKLDSAIAIAIKDPGSIVHVDNDGYDNDESVSTSRLNLVKTWIILRAASLSQ